MDIPTTNNFLLLTKKGNVQNMRFKHFIKKTSFLVLWVSTLCMPIFGVAQVSGIVFRDFNADGAKASTSSTSIEPGVSGITVMAYPSTGAVQTTTTNSTGNYSFSGLTLPVRIEFTNLPAGNYTGPQGANSGTTVQFYSAANSNANLGINTPAHYSQAAPPLVTPKYLNGNPFNDLGGNIANEDALYMYPFGASGDRQNGGTPATTLATQSQIGSTWGTAYDNNRKKLFVASVYKRHAPLGPGETGGRIYVIDNPTTAPTTPTKFIDLVSDLGISVGAVETNAARNLATNRYVASSDDNAFSKVGKVGLGDLDISDDGQFLFVVNLYDKKVYKINIAQAVAGMPNATALPAYTVPTCTNGQTRPWGLGMWQGELYLGIVCDASTGTRNDLQGYVQKFNFTTNTWTTVLNFTPTWSKGYAFLTQSGDWQKWEDTYTNFIYQGGTSNHSQPIIGDIEFDEEGSMHLALLDRVGFQLGHRNYEPFSTNLTTGMTAGEILRTYKNPSTGVFTLENNGSAGPYTSGGAGTNQEAQGGVGTNQGPGGGEFYADDYTGNIHAETLSGGLALKKGSRIIASNHMNPIDWALDTQGTLWLSTVNGLQTQEYQIFWNNGTPSPDFSKQNGLGDLEYMTEPAPLEIGNRVWHDTNKNGVQDPGEAGVAGVTIQLSKYIGGSYSSIATCVTDANGNYYFSSATGTSAVGVTYNVSGLTANSQFQLSIPTTYNGLMLTAANITSGTNSDEIDSDADGFGKISFTTESAGANNHSYDIGFQTPTEICTGEEYTLSMPPGTTGQWYKDGLPIPGATGISYVVTTAGNYSFVGTNASGCTFTSCTNAAFIQGNCARVGNYVWNDANADGLNNEAASAGINGVNIQLYKVNGGGSYTLVDSTITANKNGNPGYYQFIVHTFGDYLVRFIAPTGKNLTKTNQAANTDNNSDADGIGVSGVINLVAGTNDSTIDAGFVNACTIGNVLYLCGNSKPADADAFDHGMIEYLQGLGNTITPALTQNTSGLGLYNPMTMAALSLTNLNGFDAVFVSPSVEGVYTSILRDSLKKSRLPIWVSDYWTLSDLGLATGTGFNFQNDVYNGAAQVPFYNYTALNPTQSFTPGVFYGTYTSNADNKSLWVDAAAKTAGVAGVYFTYEPTDVLNNPTTSAPINNHGRRVFLGIHANGIYENPTNGGALPSPASAWLNPYTHLTSYGKRYLDSALAMMCTTKAPAGSIGNFVWNDTDGDGTQDVGETGINGVKVKLYQDNGSGTYILIDSTTTATNGGNAGYYSFTGLGSWNYYVQFPTTNGITPLTTQTITAATDGNSDANTANGRSPVFAINANGTGTAKDNPTIDAGYSCPTLTPSVSQVACNDNGTSQAAADDFVSFLLNPDASNSSLGIKYSVTATQGGSPITITLSDGTPATNLYHGYPSPLRTANGRAGQGNIVLTITNENGCSATVTVTDPGACSTSGICTGATVTYTYRTPFLTTDLNAVPLIIPKFDDAGGTRQLTQVNLSYGFDMGAIIVAENRAVNPQTATIQTTGDGMIDLNGSNLYSGTFANISTGSQTYATGILVPAGFNNSLWTGDSIVSSNASTLNRSMGLGLENYLQSIYANPTLSNTWVTNITGSAATDDDMQYYVGSSSISGTNTFSTSSAMAPFMGTGLVDLTASTLTGITVSGGGGNLVIAQKTKAYATITVTYTYNCIGSVGNYVWNDTDGDGNQDAGETGINGVTVELYKETTPSSGSYALAQTTTTATNAGNAGYYNFVITESANYYVHFPTTTSGKFLSTQTTTPATNGNSDANVSTGNSPIFAIDVNGTGTAKDNPTIDAGYHLGVIGNYVWYDINKDGLQNEAPSSGLNGETVILWQVGNPFAIASTTTANDANGNPGFYQFTGLAAGTYKVSFPSTVTLPGNIVGMATVFDTTALADGNSDIIPQMTNFSPAIVLAAGEVNNTIDAGFTDCVSNPTATGGEIGISSPNCFIPGNPVTIVITNLQSYTLVSPVMEIWLVNLWSGGTANTYMYNTIDALSFTHTFANTTGLDSITVRRCINNAGCALATYESNIVTLYTCKGSVGNYVWTDADGDGSQDAGETGINGVTVELYKETSAGSGSYALAQTTTTATNAGNAGYYNFIITESANYYVKFPTTSGANVLTTATRTAAVDNNSDADVTGSSPIFAININGTGTAKDNPTIDAGYTPNSTCDITPSSNYTLTISNATPNPNAGFVLDASVVGGEIDFYGQKVQAGGSLALESANWTMPASLLVSHSSGITGTSIFTFDGIDGNGSTLNPTGLGGLDMSINSDGFYYEYSVDGTPSTPYTIQATIRVYTDANNWSSQTQTIVAGLTSTTFIPINFPRGGFVTGAGTGANFANVGAIQIEFVSLTGGADLQIQNIKMPCYAPKGSVGNYVWNDTDGDGTQDAGETGINGVTVELYKETSAGSGSYALAQTTTTATNAGNAGYYNFVITESANYYVHFPTTSGVNVLSPATTTAATDGNSDANVSTGNSPIFAIDVNGTGTAKDNNTIDAGFKGIGSIGNFVWNDTDGDGNQDVGETGINGVTVELYKETTPGSGSYTLIQTTTTATNAGNSGYYNFVITESANYYVHFPTTSGVNVLSPATTTAATDGNSDANVSTGNSPIFAIDINGTGTAKDNNTIDAGFKGIGSVGNYVWTDADGDGNQDAGETGINGVTVELYKETTPGSGSYTLAQTTTTATNAGNAGYYNFVITESANYYLHFPTTNGLNIITLQTTTAATDGNSDANTLTGNSPIFAIDINGTGTAKDNPTLDVGYTPVNSTVGDYVWLDADKDGFQDATERGVSSVIVSLINSANQIVAITQTDAYGYYLFRNVLAGDYKVRFSLPIAYAFTTQEVSPSATGSDANSSGYTNTFTVNAGDNITTIDAGIYYDKILRSGLGNFVWLDNGNGRQDAGELGVANVPVMLYNTSGTQLQATLTNASGYYQFMDLAPGNYVVGVRLPLGYQFVNANQGGNDNLDSDILPATGKTGTIVLPANTFDQSNDAGIIAIASTQASIGDYVWNDANQNGLQDDTEVGMSNVIVELWDDLGSLMASTRTDAYGYYMFTDIMPGFYSVKFELPAGWAFSNPNMGANDNIDSDVMNVVGGTDTFQVHEGDRITTIDAGVYNPAATAKGVIGDFVWYDLDKDGFQDATEAGAAGITVVLYDGSNFAIARTTTDVNGKYLFVDLPVGTYSIGFSNLPIGYTFSPASQGGDGTKDSDVSPSTGKTSTITLTSNAINLDLDAGLYPAERSESYASLGDRVWYDTNNNGVQDGEEVGASKVTVRLFNATDTQIALTETDGSGRYLFSGLDAGVYYVQFDLPVGYSFSSQNQGGNDNLDSDADGAGKTPSITLAESENNFSLDAGLFKAAATSSIGDFVWHDANSDGIQNNAEKGVPGVSVTLYDVNGSLIMTTVTDKNGYYLFPFLTAGTYSVGFNNFPQIFALAAQGQGGNSATDSDPNPTTGRTSPFTLLSGQNKTDIDAGLYSARATLGDYVWNDVNANGLQDLGEPAVAGVTVHLFNNSNQYLSSAVTDAAGYYLFFNLTPGSYYVNVSDLPIQTVFTLQNAGDDAIDSDINPVTALSHTVTLAANDLNKTVDAGLNMNANASLEGYVWFDSNADGLQSTGELPVTGVLAILETTAGVALSRTITTAGGMYHFENVVPGSYKVRFTNIPAGSRFTTADANGGNNDRLDSDADAITGLSTSSYTVISGQRLHAADAGLLPPASIGGTAFEDAGNAPDGLQGPTEITFFNVIVMLYTADSTLVGQTTTDKNGNYLFTGLYPDNYFVVFGGLGGRSFTAKDIDNNLTDDLDSDVNFFGGTDLFSLSVGEDKRNVDAGYLEPGFIFPVTMAYFTAELVNTDGLLKWKTTSEVNTEHFEIYRSLDEFSYEKIGENVTAKGSPTTSQTYNALDKNVNKLNVDRVFYKLKIVDIDGTIKESNVVSLNLTHSDLGIYAQVYPNPAETTVWVDYQLFDGKTADLKVTNSLGQAMFVQTIKASDNLQQLSFDISQWADGVYYINIQSENSNFVRKIIKE